MKKQKQKNEREKLWFTFKDQQQNDNNSTQSTIFISFHLYKKYKNTNLRPLIIRNPLTKECDESWYQISKWKPQNAFIVGLYYTYASYQNVSRKNKSITKKAHFSYYISEYYSSYMSMFNP